MAIGGGFGGVSAALLIAFILTRQYIRAYFVEITAKAHKTGKCPICDKKADHDRYIGDEP